MLTSSQLGMYIHLPLTHSLSVCFPKIKLRHLILLSSITPLNKYYRLENTLLAKSLAAIPSSVGFSKGLPLV